MEKYSQMTEKILNLTLEIIYLLTGEDYGPVKKPAKNNTLSSRKSPIKDHQPHSRINTSKNEQKILKFTNRIIELLTGEVPIRSQDVTVYFSMKEWEYLEEHKDLYKEVIMANHQQIRLTEDNAMEEKPITAYILPDNISTVPPEPKESSLGSSDTVSHFTAKRCTAIRKTIQVDQILI
ncbi:gastrula zinc finger protein XlCGF66.1-like [Bufo bufo]|uniref:gastrula zinc finger protein XlCGF66.1-like n=1 Tax=Bufo bufo TaxID=8384 RepID=UPI001ABDC754|nr:gastrula zinc finger protein XlCGF66.1-like [Bufo bufo]